MTQGETIPGQHGVGTLQVFGRRENLWPAAALLLLTALAWACTIYTVYRSEPKVGMGDAMSGGVGLFLVGWVVMMAAMMMPAALPLILLYRTLARNRTTVSRRWVGMVVLIAGYLAVWALSGLPVYSYNLLSERLGSWGSGLPAALLIVGGLYQFTALKRLCHSRCSSPLFFLMRHYKPGVPGALRLGLLHGIHCLGCCVGLTVGVVGLGLMNVALMLTAAVIIFVEKTLPGGHRVAKLLGVVMVVGGLVLLVASLTTEGRMV